ncbi:Uncharacterised protein [Acinetobacter baumannii]|nr:Uncharacterised protein [Acinetobacter baumannii]
MSKPPLAPPPPSAQPSSPTPLAPSPPAPQFDTGLTDAPPLWFVWFAAVPALPSLREISVMFDVTVITPAKPPAPFEKALPFDH